MKFCLLTTLSVFHLLPAAIVHPPKCMTALGMQNGMVSDNHISASSIWNKGHRAANGRLHFHAGNGRTGAWSAKHNNKNQWLQINLGQRMKITRVATQGRQDANQWVTKYTLSYSDNGVVFTKYKGVSSCFLFVWKFHRSSLYSSHCLCRKSP